jgi:hypothetical protein
MTRRAALLEFAADLCGVLAIVALVWALLAMRHDADRALLHLTGRDTATTDAP